MRTKPLVWAHRGASGYAPENTLAAFQKAVDLGADGVELDIQLTKDDQIVVMMKPSTELQKKRDGSRIILWKNCGHSITTAPNRSISMLISLPCEKCLNS